MKVNSVGISPDVWKSLLPESPVVPKSTIWDSFPKNDLLTDLMPQIQKLKMNWIQLKLAMINGETVAKEESHQYSEYLAFPNKELQWLAEQIVSPGNGSDVKAAKIVKWVQDNITYVSDDKQYKTPEYWATPMETLKSKKGDCEDGAFLIHSLLLNAGIPWERVKTYGGEVYAGLNAPNGGHGWTAYLRETDNEWVVLDWCYYPNQDAVSERKPMKDDLKYIDDWFYITEHETVMTSYVNTIRDKMVAYSWKPQTHYIEGQRVNFTA
jgi:transglutaminase-like putative cysteine protease